MRGSYRALGVVAVLSIMAFAVQGMLFTIEGTWFGFSPIGGRASGLLPLYMRMLLGQTGTLLAVASVGIACVLAGQSRRGGWLTLLIVAGVLCGFGPTIVTFAAVYGIVPGQGGFASVADAAFYINVLPYALALLPLLALVFVQTRRHIQPEAAPVVSEQTLS